jgi:hypothetical protein
MKARLKESFYYNNFFIEQGVYEIEQVENDFDEVEFDIKHKDKPPYLKNLAIDSDDFMKMFVITEL